MNTKKLYISIVAMAVLPWLVRPNTAQAPGIVQGEAEENGAGITLLQVKKEFGELLAEFKVYGIIYQCVTVDIKAKEDINSQTIAVAYSGTQVEFLEVEYSNDLFWYKISVSIDGTEYIGYVADKYIVSAEVAFDRWRMEALELIAASRPQQRMLKISPALDSDFEMQLQVFPESYRTHLRQLHANYPNWIFVAHLTNLDWANVIREEYSEERNLIEDTVIASWKSAAPADYDINKGMWRVKSAPNWVQASEGIIKYYMDARNFLNAEGLFQFETLTYNAGIHTVTGVNAILKGTFMENEKITDNQGNSLSYAQAFMKIGAEIDVSPYLLAGRIRQEQGASGNSDLISGTYPGFSGYYNYFNIKAYGVTYHDIVTTGLTEAKACGWNTRYKALLGGAQRIATNYIARGQNTLYLQKFDVDSSDGTLYWRQYMQNLRAPESEGKSVKKAYDAMGLTNSKFVFKIPMYVNLPTAGSAAPIKKETVAATLTSVSSVAADKLEIKWKAAAGADGYQVFCSDQKGSGYEKVATCDGETTVFVDTGKTPGKNYYYKVVSYVMIDRDPLPATSSNIVMGATLAVAPPAETAPPEKPPVLSKPTIRACTSVSRRGIKISWNNVSGAAGYQLFRADSKNGTYKNIKTLSQTDHTNEALTTGKTYYFKVRAYAEHNGQRIYSAYSGIKSKKAVPVNPKITDITSSSKGTVTLKWSRISDASGYFIYRATSKNGSYKKIKTIKKNATLSYIDKGLSAKKTYYYKLKSYKTVKKVPVGSQYSGIKSIKVK